VSELYFVFLVGIYTLVMCVGFGVVRVVDNTTAE
jgi:hypothetical protein